MSRTFSKQLIFITLIISVLFLSSAAHSQESSNFISQVNFYIIDDDNDLPPVTPLDIIKDEFGNVHTWFLYIEPRGDFVAVYYQIIFANGSNFLVRVRRESISQTQFYFLQSSQLASEHQQTYAVFIETSDFGVRLIQFGWNPVDDLFYRAIDIDDYVPFGEVYGPFSTSQNTTRFYVPATDGGTEVLLSVDFDNGNFTNYELVNFPQAILTTENVDMNSIFDIEYLNDTLFVLGSVQIQAQVSHLRLVESDNGTEYTTIGSNTLNVNEIIPNPYFRAVRNSLILPELAVTTDGSIFSFLFSLDDSNPIRQLVQWTNGTTVNVFADEPENPFEITFLPKIEGVGTEVRIGALGIQFAQGEIAITADRFGYNVISDVLTRDKVQDPSFSTNIFLFSFDLAADYILGMAATLSVPDYIKQSNNIANSTVGSLTLFSDQATPDVPPASIGVFFSSGESQTADDGLNVLVISIIVFSIFTLSMMVFWYIRKKQLALPKELEVEKKENSRMDRFKTFLYVQKLFLKTNRRRIVISIFVLVLPSMLIITVFSGMLTHQENLLSTYNESNPINDPNNLQFQEGNFVWDRVFYDDELSNNSISEVEWELPQVLSSLSLDRYGLSTIVDSLSYTTLFPLYEKRVITFLNNEGENQTIHYPFPHNFAVLPIKFLNYMESQLVDGRLPVASNEVLVQDSWFVQRDGFNTSYPFGSIFETGTEIELHGSEIDIFFNSSVANLSQNITIVGTISSVESLSFEEIKDWAQRLGMSVPALRVLDAVPFYSTPLLITTLLNDFSRLSIRPTSFVDIRYDLDAIERDDIPDLLDDFDILLNTTLQETGFAWLGNFTDTQIVEFLSNYYDASRDILLESTVLILPVFSLIIFLTYEALAIGRSAIEEELQRFEREGIKFENVFVLLLSERSLSAATASLVAFISVQPLLNLTLSFTDLFNIEAYELPTIPLSTIALITLGNFILMAVIGLFQSVRYYFEARNWQFQDYMTNLQKDVVIVIAGLLIFGFASVLLNLFENQLTSSDSDNLSDLLIVSLRMISLIVLALAGFMIGSKILSRIFMGLGILIWNIKKSKLSLIGKGVSSHAGLYGKITITVLLALFILIPMIIVPNTLATEYQQDAYYDLGTDMILQDFHEMSSDKQQSLQDLDEFSSTSPYYFGVLNFENNIRIRVLAIDPGTFLSSVVMPERYEENFELSEEEINYLSNNEVITNTEFLDRNPIDIGDTFSLGYNHLSDDVETIFRVAGEYSQFPIMRYELLGLDSTDNIPLQMVISLSTLEIIQANYALNASSSSSFLVEDLDRRNLLMRLNSEYSESEAVESVEEIADNQLVLLSNIELKYKHPFFDVFEYISHVSLIVALLSPVLASYVVSNVMFERRKFELEVYHRNGVSIGYFSFQQSMELVVTSLLPGAITGFYLGIWWTTNYGAELFGESFANIDWQVPVQLIYGLVVLLPVVSLLIWFVQTYYRSKKHLQEVRL